MTQLVWGPIDCGRGVTLDSSLTPAETAELQWLAQDRNVLEVGSCFGYSTLKLAQTGSQHVFAVDPHMEQLGGIPFSLPTMRNALRTFELESKVTICLSYSQDVLPHLHAIGAQFDLIFVDGDHRAPAVEHDLEWTLRLRAPYSALCFHDYTNPEWPDVQTVLDHRFPDGPTRQIDTLWVIEEPR